MRKYSYYTIGNKESVELQLAQTIKFLDTVNALYLTVRLSTVVTSLVIFAAGITMFGIMFLIKYLGLVEDGIVMSPVSAVFGMLGLLGTIGATINYGLEKVDNIAKKFVLRKMAMTLIDLCQMVGKDQVKFIGNDIITGSTGYLGAYASVTDSLPADDFSFPCSIHKFNMHLTNILRLQRMFNESAAIKAGDKDGKPEIKLVRT